MDCQVKMAASLKVAGFIAVIFSIKIVVDSILARVTAVWRVGHFMWSNGLA